MGDGASSQLPGGNGPTAMAIPVDGGPPRRMCLGCCLPLARSLLPQTVCGEGGERADALTSSCRMRAWRNTCPNNVPPALLRLHDDLNGIIRHREADLLTRCCV